MSWCALRAGIVLISDILRAELGADCSVLMGANVANDMASDQFCETTIGYKVPENGELFRCVRISSAAVVLSSGAGRWWGAVLWCSSGSYVQ